MGFSFSTTQALMARELLVGFTGNELSIGLVLGGWLALEALGSGVLGRLAGLSLGGWWMARWLRTKPVGSSGPVTLRSTLLRLEVAIVIYLAVFPLALAFLHARAPEPAELVLSPVLSPVEGPVEVFAWVRVALLGLNGVAGLLVGLEFPLANALYLPATVPLRRHREASRTGETAGILYAADLVGACLGALAVSVALLPALGILETCAFLVVLKVGSLALVVTMK